MLMLDARVEAPSHCITLTTHDPETTATMYRKASEAVWLRLRRRYGRVEYYGRIEFTTGRAALSGGYRRMHGHYPIKGLGGVDCSEATEIVRETWRKSLARHGASYEAWWVEVAELRTAGAVLHYLSLHHAKAAQAPPAEWRGMVERPSQGYFSIPVAELRAEARAQLWAEGLAYSTGLSVGDARILVDGQLAEWADGRELFAAARAERAWTPIEAPTLDSYEPGQMVLDADIPF